MKNMPETFGFDTYLSPFTKRYGSPKMRGLWSEIKAYADDRKTWSALASAQAYYGIVSSEELADIKSKAGPEFIDPDRIRDIDRRIHHNLMAEVEHYAEQCLIGGKKIHYGGTSMDIEDNEDIIRMREASDIIITRIVNTLDSFAPHIKEYKKQPAVAWTHLQPAGYTTVGYRLANRAQGIVKGLVFLEFVKKNFLLGKGMKGIVGTSSAYQTMLKDKGKAYDMEKMVLDELNLDAFLLTTQVYPRYVDYAILSALALLASESHKFALDLRLFSSPVIGEMYKKPKEGKVGSSHAPWKIYNPTEAERIDSLARYVAVLPQIAWMNAAGDIFERTLDDSANRRVILPESFLATDQIFIEYDNILRNLGVRIPAIEKHIKDFGTFLNVENLMIEAVNNGANRQEIHKAIGENIPPAYEALLATGKNPLSELLTRDERITRYVPADKIENILSDETIVKEQLGDSVERTGKFMKRVLHPTLRKYKDKLGEHIEPEF